MERPAATKPIRPEEVTEEEALALSLVQVYPSNDYLIQEIADSYLDVVRAFRPLKIDLTHLDVLNLV